MENSQNKLDRIFASTSLTEVDREWLCEYISNTPDSVLSFRMRRDFDDNREAEVFSDKQKDEILSAIHKKAGINQSVVQMTGFKRKFSWGIALSIFAAFMAVVFLLNHKTYLASSVAAKAKPMGAGGSTIKSSVKKPLLTLSDGVQVSLDNKERELIATDGTTELINENGKLIYSGSVVKSSVVLYNTLEIPAGLKYEMKLSDGSLVWLNANSSITFPVRFGSDERRVTIKGEVYFEIAKNPSRPFIVEVNDAEVRVLGTHFNITAYDEEQTIKTTLIEGAVQFKHGTGITSLKPGQQSAMDKNGLVTVTHKINPLDEIAWKDGFFHFEGEDIKFVMRKLSRWYDIDISLLKSDSDEKYFADIPFSTPLEDVLRVLSMTGNLKFHMKGNKIIASPE